MLMGRINKNVIDLMMCHFVEDVENRTLCYAACVLFSLNQRSPKHFTEFNKIINNKLSCFEFDSICFESRFESHKDKLYSN